MFLLVTNKRDITSDFIVQELRRRSYDFFRFNTEDFPSFKFTQGFGSSSRLHFDGREVEIEKVDAAYFRRPLPPETIAKSLPASSIKYMHEEWSYLLRSLYLEIGEKWFSHPNKIILSEDKPRQLRIAQNLGLLVPETIITNEISSLASLFEGGEVVAKPLKQSLLEDADGPGKVIYTNTIHSLNEIDEISLGMAPVIFQRKIPKKLDIRVTVVEDSVFPVAIHSQEFDQTSTDWRHSSISELEHEVFSLPEETADKCRAIVKHLGLRYGAIDLVLDTKGAFWFLECNPNGQWAWIEQRSSLPIAKSIVDAMEAIAK